MLFVIAKSVEKLIALNINILFQNIFINEHFKIIKRQFSILFFNSVESGFKEVKI